MHGAVMGPFVLGSWLVARQHGGPADLVAESLLSKSVSWIKYYIP